jgi:hypothetical protein
MFHPDIMLRNLWADDDSRVDNFVALLHCEAWTYFVHIVNILLCKCSPVLLLVSNSTVSFFLLLHSLTLYSLTNVSFYVFLYRILY